MTQTHKWNMADTITATRMAATVFLLFLPLNSVSFFAAYTLTGFTDVLDGWIARKTGKTSAALASHGDTAGLIYPEYPVACIATMVATLAPAIICSIILVTVFAIVICLSRRGGASLRR